MLASENLPTVPPIFLLFAVFAVLALLAKIFKPQIKGFLGEGLLHVVLSNRLDSAVYTVLHNIMLPDGPGATTQIDHIVVSRHGVFVIETKTYKGWIFGDAKSAQWTQSLPGGRKFRFQNPLRQNYKHTKTLAAAIGVPEQAIFPVIAFSGECAFKTKMPDNVMHFGNVPGYIQSFRDVVFHDKDVAALREAIKGQDASLSGARKRAHVSNLRRRHDL